MSWGNFSPDGRTLFTNDSRSVQLWDVTTGKEIRRFLVDKVCAAAVSPDGKTLATGGADGMIRLWEVATGKQRHRFQGHQGGSDYLSSPSHQGGVVALAWSADGKLLVSGGADTAVLVWDVRRLGDTSAPR